MRFTIIAWLLTFATWSGGLAQESVPDWPGRGIFPPEVNDPAPGAHAALIDSVLTSLDARTRAGQMIVVYRTDNATLLEQQFGGVLLFSNMLADTSVLRRDLVELQAAAPVGYFVCLDQEGGNVSRLDSVPGWQGGAPGAVDLAGWTPQAVHAEGRRIGSALAALGVNLNLAPVLDSAVTWDGRESWMGHRGRAFGSTKEQILTPAVAFARGCRQAGVVCIGKHYPGYDVPGNTDREVQISGADLDQLAWSEHRFAAARDAMAGVMMSSVIYTALTERPAVLEDRLVARAHFTPRHVVMTDDLWSLSLRRWLRPELEVAWEDYPADAWAELGREVLWAGNDLLLVTYPEKAIDLRDSLVLLMETEPWARDAVELAVTRILWLKAEMELLPGQ